ncbi:MAG TPA: LacI family DNA-binding transcriptional regulator [Dermatophilaceae bacterium]|nr:LacI family DNA-binding transcriptional regulator [Dermatophilaceae bacterium]
MVARPNLEHVAARAGVSRATVSRVVNGQATVAEDLRARVQKAVDELGYVPNQAARALMTRRSDAVALLASEPAARVFGDPFFSGIIRGVSIETNRAGLQLVLLMAQDFEDLERVKRFLKASPVDGVMLISGHDGDGLPEELARLGIPHVIGGRPPLRPADEAYVDNENVAGAEVATRHLTSLGRIRIGTVTGPLDMSAGVDRLDGYRNVLGPDFRDELVEEGDFTQRGGEAAMERLLNRAPDLDAVFAASDLMALGALAALRRAGRRVPEDVALVGFDDNEFAMTSDPPLTTIRQDPMVQGRAMVRLYLALHRPDIEVAPEEGIPDVTGVDHVILPVSLVVRESA